MPALARPSLHRQELFAVMATAKWEERLQKTFPENLAIRGFYPLVLLTTHESPAMENKDDISYKNTC